MIFVLLVSDCVGELFLSDGLLAFLDWFLYNGQNGMRVFGS